MVVSQNFDQHLSHLELFFEACRVHYITLSFDKLHVCKKLVKFLGFILSQHSLTTDPDKLKKIKEFPRPNNIKQLRSFIGLINFHARFT